MYLERFQCHFHKILIISNLNKEGLKVLANVSTVYPNTMWCWLALIIHKDFFNSIKRGCLYYWGSLCKVSADVMYIGCDGDRRDLCCANLIYSFAGRGFNKNKYGNHILCYSGYICGNLTKEPKSKTEYSQMIKNTYIARWHI